MSKFQDLWKTTGGRIKSHDVRIQAELSEVKEEVHEMDERLDQYETPGGSRKAAIEDTDEYESTDPMHKDRVEKPGASTHTAKWDRCVEHVKASGSGADPYAVCTAMLGDESFKSMDEGKFNEVLDKALGSFGIAAAGPIPESLLARQDLEGTTSRKSAEGFTPRDALISRIKGNQKAAVEKGSSFKDAWSRVKPR